MNGIKGRCKHGAQIKRGECGEEQLAEGAFCRLDVWRPRSRKAGGGERLYGETLTLAWVEKSKTPRDPC
jgi:hypothetical protein